MVDAPVAGRVCSTGPRMVPEVTETLVAYDEANRSLTYEASGMPAFVTTARNTWTVAPLGDRRCRVTLDAQFDTRGVFGGLARRLLLRRSVGPAGTWPTTCATTWSTVLRRPASSVSSPAPAARKRGRWGNDGHRVSPAGMAADLDRRIRDLATPGVGAVRTALNVPARGGSGDPVRTLAG